MGTLLPLGCERRTELASTGLGVGPLVPWFLEVAPLGAQKLICCLVDAVTFPLNPWLKHWQRNTRTSLVSNDKDSLSSRSDAVRIVHLRATLPPPPLLLPAVQHAAPGGWRTRGWGLGGSPPALGAGTCAAPWCKPGKTEELP